MKKINVSKMSLKQVVEMAIALRKSADSSEIEFVEFLMAVEATDVWRPACSGTFESFLTRQHICSEERYSRGKLALNECANEVPTIGIQAAKQAIRIEDLGKRIEALSVMGTKARDQGYPLSDWTAREITEKYLPRKEPVSRVDTLEMENRQLRAEVQRLKAEVRQLRKQLADVENAVGARSSKKASADGASKKGRSQAQPRA
jgi:hypothetical protein